MKQKLIGNNLHLCFAVVVCQLSHTLDAHGRLLTDQLCVFYVLLRSRFECEGGRREGDWMVEKIHTNYNSDRPTQLFLYYLDMLLTDIF